MPHDGHPLVERAEGTRSPERGTVIGRSDEHSYGPLFQVERYLGDRGEVFGLTKQEKGYNFSIRVDADVKSVDFCVPDRDGVQANGLRWELYRMEDTPNGAAIWGGHIAGLMEGDLYSVRVDREDDPHSYQTALLDPYAYSITRLGYPDHPNSPVFGRVIDTADDIVVSGGPTIDPQKRVIYETHIGDATQNHPDIPEELRGTFLGFSHPAHVEHLKKLGVTSVEVVPMQFVTEDVLIERKRLNHWGYNTLGFFAPHEGYATAPGRQVREWKLMVNALHEAGIEVIADVVYNHTADGPLHREVIFNGETVDVGSHTYSLRGLDNEGYYGTYTNEEGERDYWDTTGCGNNVDTRKPAAAQLVRDSLVYWTTRMGIDGARFDLAPSVGDNAFFKWLKQHPKLSDLLMIAEPWSWGAGYPKTTFANVGMPEWNGEDFRDPVRDFWRGQGNLGALAYAMEGSYNPQEVVNFLTAHDGDTLLDLVSYNEKHNLPNGENNQDGTNDNRAWNHGVEGLPEDLPSQERERIIELRRKTIHNMMHTLFMSWGMVMWLGGDEKLHTQHGNNNAYCRRIDGNEVDIHARNWELDSAQQHMVETVTKLITLRQQGAMGNPRATVDELPESPIHERGQDRFSLWGERIERAEDRQDETMKSYMNESRVIGMYTSGQMDDNASYLTYVNGSPDDVQVSLPKELAAAGDYVLVSDTESGRVNPDGLELTPQIFTLKAMSSVILKRVSSRLPERQLSSPKTNRRFSFPSINNVIQVTYGDVNGAQPLQQDGALPSAA